MNKKEAKKRRAEIEAEIRTHVAAEKNAHLWVEKSALEDSLSFEDFEKMVNEIMPNHYKDIIEERGISGTCGYPMCTNQIKVVKQKYHISLTSNKVIDLSERKLFCSIHCYKSSVFVEKQIPISPLWLRPDRFKLKLFESSSDDIERNDILELDIRKIRKEEIDRNIHTKKIDKKEDDVDSNDDIDDISSQLYNTKIANHTSQELNKQSINNERKIKLIETLENPELKSHKISLKITKKEPSSELISENDKIRLIIQKLLKRLEDWFTNKTIIFLQQPTDYEKKLQEKLSQQMHEKTMNFYSPNPVWVKEIEVPADENKIDCSIPENSKTQQDSIRRKIVKDRVQGCLKKLPINVGELSNSGFFKIIDTFRLSRDNIVLKYDEWIIMVTLLLEIFSESKTNIRRLYDTIDVASCIETKCHVTFNELREIAKNFYKDFNKKISSDEDSSYICYLEENEKTRNTEENSIIEELD